MRLGKSTPIRIVFDAAARSGKAAKSLNDLILKGGNWVNEIPAVLLRFRRYGVGVTSDIARAFHQISIAPKDRDVVRFLWLRDPAKPPSKENLCVYRFRRMAFGVVASPFLLTATIRHHLREYPNEFSQRIEEDLYADNLITSLPRTVSGEKFYRVVKECFADMSMNISQWMTDCAELRRSFSAEDAVPGAQQMVLGLEWNTDRMELSVRTPRLPLTGCEVITKRNVLREMATVYDPLGWVSPVVLMARLFLRRVWQGEYTWEKPLAAELAEEWRALRNVLNAVSSLALPHAYGFGGIEGADAFELHAFCDASGEAYGVVIYLVVCERGRSWTGLVAAKTRLTPKTPLSIPRLELLAAVTASKYLGYVETALKLEKSPTRYLWGDARCVISWVSSRRLLPAFVEKSVRLIRGANFERFLYVPSAENPADAASRGASMEELREAHWWSGPSWLASGASWPQQKDGRGEETARNAAETIVELSVEEERILLTRALVQVKKTVNPTCTDGSPLGINPADYETVGRLTRLTAICLRAAGRFLRGRGTLPADGPLDYALARRMWLRWDQQRIYEPAEGRNTNVSYLRNLRVSEDEHGLLRCETRIKSAKVTRDEAEPILLVKRSGLTRLVILSIHRNNFHSGTAHTLAALRRSYWLPQGRREVYQVVKGGCLTCRRYDARPFRAPEMAPLPPFRINRTETPFTNVGVDVFGPFQVKCVEDGKVFVRKRWVTIYTCLVVRAVHLEVLRNMSAEEFLNSFRRFVGRRGVPKLVVCDNAPQFYVVEGVFRSVFQEFAHADAAERYYAQHGIEWRFIPASSPWMGGAYERLIKEIKGAFTRVYGDQVLKEAQFEVAIIEVEGVINARPITYVDRDEETELIAPNDFLCLRYPAVAFNASASQRGSALAVSWRAGREYLDRFWRIWAEQYLREIRERRDAMRSGRADHSRAPIVGEIVLMIDPNLKRSSWRVAVVERLIKSSDDKVRSVQLRTGNHTRLVRPVVKLAPLRLLMDQPEGEEEQAGNQLAIAVQDLDGEVLIP